MTRTGQVLFLIRHDTNYYAPLMIKKKSYALPVVISQDRVHRAKDLGLNASDAMRDGLEAAIYRREQLIGEFNEQKQKPPGAISITARGFKPAAIERGHATDVDAITGVENPAEPATNQRGPAKQN